MVALEEILEDVPGPRRARMLRLVSHISEGRTVGGIVDSAHGRIGWSELTIRRDAKFLRERGVLTYDTVTRRYGVNGRYGIDVRRKSKSIKNDAPRLRSGSSSSDNTLPFRVTEQHLQDGMAICDVILGGGTQSEAVLVVGRNQGYIHSVRKALRALGIQVEYHRKGSYWVVDPKAVAKIKVMLGVPLDGESLFEDDKRRYEELGALICGRDGKSYHTPTAVSRERILNLYDVVIALNGRGVRDESVKRSLGYEGASQTTFGRYFERAKHSLRALGIGVTCKYDGNQKRFYNEFDPFALDKLDVLLGITPSPKGKLLSEEERGKYEGLRHIVVDKCTIIGGAGRDGDNGYAVSTARLEGRVLQAV